MYAIMKDQCGKHFVCSAGGETPEETKAIVEAANKSGPVQTEVVDVLDDHDAAAAKADALNGGPAAPESAIESAPAPVTSKCERASAISVVTEEGAPQ